MKDVTESERATCSSRRARRQKIWHPLPSAAIISLHHSRGAMQPSSYNEQTPRKRGDSEVLPVRRHFCLIVPRAVQAFHAPHIQRIFHARAYTQTQAQKNSVSHWQTHTHGVTPCVRTHRNTYPRTAVLPRSRHDGRLHRPTHCGKSQHARCPGGREDCYTPRMPSH
jgi:hypothetical protein